jgi:hypothetical protein
LRRVRLIHWKAEEAIVKAELLREAGYVVDCGTFNRDAMVSLREDPPAAVVIDLSRLPSQGRDVAVALRMHRSTRQIPLVLAGGDPGKVARIREHLPDATYTTWAKMADSLKAAIDSPASDPVVPRSAMVFYSDAPLCTKLGIKKGTAVCLINAPTGFEGLLGRLPEGARLLSGSESTCDLIICFVGSMDQLRAGIDEVRGRIGIGGLWIAWPKKASGVQSDLTQNEVRRVGLSKGLVDYKIASIDDTWSGLRFARREG